MTDLVGALAIAFGVVFVAELGDKTQLLALDFGARYPLRIVALGLAVGYGVANLAATIVGGVLGAALPDRAIQVVGGVIFLGFALAALRRSQNDVGESPTDIASTGRLAVVSGIGATIALAELGDKTQIATATLASQASPIGVWIGATLGAAASGMVGAVAGNMIGDRVPTRALGIASAVLFAVFGVAMLAGWF